MKESIEKLLKNRDIKPTSGRILIFKAMKEFDSAFSLGDLENKLVSVDKSTISRAIHLFNNNGLIHSFDDGSGAIKYSICKDDCNCEVSDSHIHFYCNYCKKAFCLENILMPKFELPQGMEMEGINLVIKGYCGECDKFAT